jgi:chromate transporter
VIFGDVRTVTAGVLDLDVPVWGSLNPAAALLVIAAMVAVFRFGLGTLTVLAASAAAGLALGAMGLT